MSYNSNDPAYLIGYQDGFKNRDYINPYDVHNHMIKFNAYEAGYKRGQRHAGYNKPLYG